MIINGQEIHEGDILDVTVEEEQGDAFGARWERRQGKFLVTLSLTHVSGKLNHFDLNNAANAEIEIVQRGGCHGGFD